jgi:16S rRNA (cytidine1402-2'-O)-methyltransferase
MQVYFVATPIGNLKDISYRAIEVLKSVNVIACEDTNHSLILLNNYDIHKTLISYHKFNEKEESEKIISLIKSGKNIAIISDAGMPIISDPGAVLAKRLIEENIDYTVIPGANAGLTALLLSGFDATNFTFCGFLKGSKSEKVNYLNSIKTLTQTLIFYSSSHDIIDDLKLFCEVLGNRKVAVVNEITKIYEKVLRFSLNDKFDFEPKGEYVVIIEGSLNIDNELNNLSIEEHIKHYLDMGIDKKSAIKQVAIDRNMKKSDIYNKTIK